MIEEERRKEVLGCLDLMEESVGKLAGWMKEKDVIRAIEELRINLKEVEEAVNKAGKNLDSIMVGIEPILRKEINQKEKIEQKMKRLETKIKGLKGMYFLTPDKVVFYKEAVRKLQKEFDEFKVNLRKII